MDIEGRTVLVLGGAGLVGSAVCRELLTRGPSRLVVGSLARQEVERAVEELRQLAPGSPTELAGVHGNLFVRASLKDVPREELLRVSSHRRAIVEDTLLPLTDAVVQGSALYQALAAWRPQIVVDCVNTATALAYQEPYRSALEVFEHLELGHGMETARDSIERLLATQDTPQLIRHVQILHESLRRCGARFYLKVGTTGTGGMGLNIPYTHSEERPSRALLAKSAMAGAHTMLLFLMARTPGAPLLREIKPAAAVAWRKIAFGPVLRAGRPIPLYDCPPELAVDLELEKDLGASREFPRAGEGEEGVLRSVYVDTGENGMFARAEFEVVTSLGQMEYVTPEEIARDVLFEIEGIPSGHDVLAALDQAVMGPTYRAGVLRARALETLERLEREHRVSSVAFEMLGPPRLTKLLFEADILRRLRPSLEAAAAADPRALAAEAEKLVATEGLLRAEILSVGIPILLPDGRRLLRGPRAVVPAATDRADPTPDRRHEWAEQGWVDLRPSNFERWRERCRLLLEERAAADSSDTSSRPGDGLSRPAEPGRIDPGKLVGWLFLSEERGMRLKE
jgi:hypothetical protein